MGIDKWQIGILQPDIPRSPQWSPLAQGEISGRWRLHLLLPISFKPAQGDGGPTRPLHLAFIEPLRETMVDRDCLERYGERSLQPKQKRRRPNFPICGVFVFNRSAP